MLAARPRRVGQDINYTLSEVGRDLTPVGQHLNKTLQMLTARRAGMTRPYTLSETGQDLAKCGVGETRGCGRSLRTANADQCGYTATGLTSRQAGRALQHT